MATKSIGIVMSSLGAALLCVSALQSAAGQTVVVDGSSNSARRASDRNSSGATVVDGYARRSTYARSAAARSSRTASGSDPYGSPSTGKPNPTPTPTTPSTQIDESTPAEPTTSERESVEEYAARYANSVFERGYESASYSDAAFASESTLSGHAVPFDDSALSGYADRRVAYRNRGYGWSGSYYYGSRYGVWYGSRRGRWCDRGYEYPAWNTYTSRRYDCYPSSSWSFRSSFGSGSHRFRSRSYPCGNWGYGSYGFGRSLYSGCGTFGGFSIRFSF
ncbi:MAG: hypothetical protein HND57_06455 [Planctomycetes bacterium]|nr:hypothetical protein [Planctomycetota bacterium]